MCDPNVGTFLACIFSISACLVSLYFLGMYEELCGRNGSLLPLKKCLNEHIKSEDVLHIEPEILKEFRNSLVEMRHTISLQNEIILHQNNTIKSLQKELMELRHITIETMREMSMVMQNERLQFDQKLNEKETYKRNLSVNDVSLNYITVSVYMVAFGELVLVSVLWIIWKKLPNTGNHHSKYWFWLKSS